MMDISLTDRRWNGEPGSWFPVRRENGERSAVLICPKCGRAAGLSHRIAGDGAVSPSVVCPYEPCDFHEFIRLTGWADVKERPNE